MTADERTLLAQVGRLKALVSWLHPDPTPDPLTARMVDDLGLLTTLESCLHEPDDHGRCSICHQGVAWRECAR